MGDREWGDGKGSMRPHVVYDISLAPGAEYIICSCGDMIMLGDHLNMDDAFRVHRGLEVAPVNAHRVQANDVEVSEFLAKIADKDYRPDLTPLLTPDHRAAGVYARGGESKEPGPPKVGLPPPTSTFEDWYDKWSKEWAPK